MFAISLSVIFRLMRSLPRVQYGGGFSQSIQMRATSTWAGPGDREMFLETHWGNVHEIHSGTGWVPCRNFENLSHFHHTVSCTVKLSIQSSVKYSLTELVCYRSQRNIWADEELTSASLIQMRAVSTWAGPGDILEQTEFPVETSRTSLFSITQCHVLLNTQFYVLRNYIFKVLFNIPSW